MSDVVDGELLGYLEQFLPDLEQFPDTPLQLPLLLRVKQLFNQRAKKGSHIENIVSNLSVFKLRVAGVRTVAGGGRQLEVPPQLQAELLFEDRTPVYALAPKPGDKGTHAPQPGQRLLEVRNQVMLNGEVEMQLTIHRSVTSYNYRSRAKNIEFRVRVFCEDSTVDAVITDAFKIQTKLNTPKAGSDIPPLHVYVGSPSLAPPPPPAPGLASLPGAGAADAVSPFNLADVPNLADLPELAAYRSLSSDTSSPMTSTSTTLSAEASPPTDERCDEQHARPAQAAVHAAAAAAAEAAAVAAAIRIAAPTRSDTPARGRQRSEPVWKESSLPKRRASVSPTGEAGAPAEGPPDGFESPLLAPDLPTGADLSAELSTEPSTGGAPAADEVPELSDVVGEVLPPAAQLGASGGLVRPEAEHVMVTSPSMQLSSSELLDLLKCSEDAKSHELLRHQTLSQGLQQARELVADDQADPSEEKKQQLDALLAGLTSGVF